MDKEYLKENLIKIVFGLVDYDPEEVAVILASDDELSEEYQKIRRVKLLFKNAARQHVKKNVYLIINNDIKPLDKDSTHINLNLFTSYDTEDKHIVVIREGDIIYEDTLTPDSYSISMAADSGEEPTIDEPILVDHQETDQYERNIFTVPAEGKVIFQLKFKS